MAVLTLSDNDDRSEVSGSVVTDRDVIYADDDEDDAQKLLELAGNNIKADLSHSFSACTKVGLA